MDIEAELKWFEIKIRKVFADDLERMSSLPPHAIETILKEHPFNDLTEEELAAIRRGLEFELSVRQESGHTIRSDYKPWLKDRTDIDFYYWNRLRKYYLDSNTPKKIIFHDNLCRLMRINYLSSFHLAS